MVVRWFGDTSSVPGGAGGGGGVFTGRCEDSLSISCNFLSENERGAAG